MGFFTKNQSGRLGDELKLRDYLVTLKSVKFRDTHPNPDYIFIVARFYARQARVPVKSIIGRVSIMGARNTDTFEPVSLDDYPHPTFNPLAILERSSAENEGDVVFELPRKQAKHGVDIYMSEYPEGFVPGGNNFRMANWSVRLQVTQLRVDAEVPFDGMACSVIESPDATLVFVGIGSDDSESSASYISLVDTRDFRKVASIPTDGLPMAMAASSDSAWLWVANSDGDGVSLIDVARKAVVATIPTGELAVGVALASHRGICYVANAGSDTVSAIDVTSRLVIDTIRIREPHSVSVSPDGRRVYVASAESNTVSLIDTDQNRVVAELHPGDGPLGIALTPDSHALFVSNSKADSISVYNPSTCEKKLEIPTGAGPMGLAIAPDGSRCYVAQEDEEVVGYINCGEPVCCRTNLRSIGAPMGVAVSAKGNRIYSTNHDGITVAKT